MSTTYEIVEDGKAIKCLTCNLTSYHPEDVRNRYCGKCHVIHEDRDLLRQVFRSTGWIGTVPSGRVTSTKPSPNAHLMRPMTAEAGGIEPPWIDTYQRRVRVEGEEE